MYVAVQSVCEHAASNEVLLTSANLHAALICPYSYIKSIQKHAKISEESAKNQIFCGFVGVW